MRSVEEAVRTLNKGDALLIDGYKPGYVYKVSGGKYFICDLALKHILPNIFRRLTFHKPKAVDLRSK